MKQKEGRREYRPLPGKVRQLAEVPLSEERTKKKMHKLNKRTRPSL